LQILSCVKNKKFQHFPSWTRRGGGSPWPEAGGRKYPISQVSLLIDSWTVS